MTNKRLLAVLAHPDDESFGPGGTFARYVREGGNVHVAIATDGVAGSVADGYEDALKELVAVRDKELEAAVKILGVTLHKLGYRDSGYINNPANHHPDAFINSDEVQAIGKVVQLIREIQPQIVVTHDETGGYFHPDHIHCCKITTAAFQAAGAPAQYPEIGPVPHQPERLYYTAFPNSMVRFYIFVLRLRGKDPTAQGKNKDIDFTRLGIPPQKIHARINWGEYWDVKMQASAQHASQGGGTSQGRNIPVWLQKHFLAKDNFIRAYPPAPDGFKESSLFPE